MRRNKSTMFKFIITVAIALNIAMLVVLVSGDYNLDSENEISDSYQSVPTLHGVSGQDCAIDECSVMGFQRYSQPECRARGQEGDTCRMYAEPENKTLIFPNVILECQDVYMQFCPCATGLVCVESECRRSVGKSRLSERSLVESWDIFGRII